MMCFNRWRERANVEMNNARMTGWSIAGHRFRIIEGKEAQPAPHPLPHFIIQNGLLYCVARWRREEKLLLGVPRTKTETVPELAHSHPLAGHLGATNTIQRDRFHWPVSEAEVKRFCQACPTCQVTSPRMPPPVRWYRCPSSRCPSSASGQRLWGCCLSLPGDMNKSWWLSTMPPIIQRQFPSEKPPPKPSPRNSSCSPAESASQRRSWPIRVPPLCPG